MSDPKMFTMKDGKQLEESKALALSAAEIKEKFALREQMELFRLQRNAAKRAAYQKNKTLSGKTHANVKSKKVDDRRAAVKKLKGGKDPQGVEVKAMRAKQKQKDLEKKREERPTSTGVCSICGKPLSKHTSVSQGMGDTCASKIKLLPAGTTLEDHYAGLAVYEEPGNDYLPIGKAIEQAKKMGVSGYAFLVATGGDRHLRKPLNEHFQVVMFHRKRYVPKSSLKHLGDIGKVK